MKNTKGPLQSDNGVAMLLEVVLAAVVLSAIGYGVYAYHSHTTTTAKAAAAKTVAPATAVNTGVDATCLATYHDADLCHFAGNSTSLEKMSYKATITVAQSGGSPSTMVLENDGKGNTELTGSSNGSSFNSIELAGATYLEVNGTWIKYPAGSSSAAAPADPASSMNIGVTSSGVTYKKIDTEACGSLTCFKYQITDSASPGSTQYAWFDNSSYLLREWKSSDSSGSSTNMTISYQTISITAPSPVQDYSAATGL